METDDGVEERLGDEERRIWVAERHEMDHLGETIHNREHHRFTFDPRESLDEIQGDVAPHCRRHVDGLKQVRRMEVFLLR